MNPSLTQFPAMNHYRPYYGDRQRQMIPFRVGVRLNVDVRLGVVVGVSL